MQQLMSGLAALLAANAIGAGAAIDTNSTRIDMEGYEGVVFILPIDDSVATGVASLTVEQNDADSDDGMSALVGAVASKTCLVNDDLNGQLLIVDVLRPAKRYVQAVATSATANIAFGNMIALKYSGRIAPVPPDAGVAAIAKVVSPAEA